MTLDNGTTSLASNCQRQVFTFGGTAPACGDGYRNGSEVCEAADLDGQTCASLNVAPAGPLACSGACSFDTSGCGCPGGGIPLANGCWYLGGEGASCDTTCSGVGLTYSALTASYAGSGGTEAQCLAILDALGATEPPNGTVGDYPGAPFGCVLDSQAQARVRFYDPPTTSEANGSRMRRACACQ